jgi:predicted DNA binding CopG/RHH family protein
VNETDFHLAVKKSVQNMLLKYPNSSLKDIYKSFFQDEFGPGHLLEDHEVAKKYFDQELHKMGNRNRYSIEPCGIGVRFFRANMDLIIGGFLSASEYFELFLDSSHDFLEGKLPEWIEKWRLIEEIVRPFSDRVDYYEEDHREINRMISDGIVAIHHSERYRKSYDPHYRVLSVRHKSILIGRINEKMGFDGCPYQEPEGNPRGGRK